MGEDETSVGAQPLPVRRRFRLVALEAALLLVMGSLGGYLFLANNYMPLAEGSGSGPDSGIPGSLFARATDQSGGRTQFVYCSKPNSRIDWYITLVNNGPVVVTVLGGDPGPGRVPADANGNGFSLVDLAIYRQALPADTPAMSHDRTDPRTAPAMPATTLAQGGELEVWARFQTGGLELPSSTGETMSTIWVRYSVLGVTRTAEVPLRDSIDVEGGCTPS
jgi:hypothetical protein